MERAEPRRQAGAAGRGCAARHGAGGAPRTPWPWASATPGSTGGLVRPPAAQPGVPAATCCVPAWRVDCTGVGEKAGRPRQKPDGWLGNVGQGRRGALHARHEGRRGRCVVRALLRRGRPPCHSASRLEAVGAALDTGGLDRVRCTPEGAKPKAGRARSPWLRSGSHNHREVASYTGGGGGLARLPQPSPFHPSSPPWSTQTRSGACRPHAHHVGRL